MERLSEERAQRVHKVFFQIMHTLEEEELFRHEVCALVSCFFKTSDFSELQYYQKMVDTEIVNRIADGTN